MPRKQHGREAGDKCPNGGKPRLLIDDGDLPATARELRELLAADGMLFDRDMPVRLIQPAAGGPMILGPAPIPNLAPPPQRPQFIGRGSAGRSEGVVL